MVVYRLAVDDPTRAAPVSLFGKNLPTDESHTWIIFGVAYTTHEGVAAYARRKDGWTVQEVPTIPPHYLEQCERLDKWPVHYAHGGPTSDAADSDARYRYPAPGDRTVDVRHILDGILTA